MDTISRDNNSSYLPVAGVIVGLLAVVLSAIALVKISSTSKSITAHEEKIAKIDGIEAQVGGIGNDARKAQSDVATLQRSTQGAIDQVATMLGDLSGKVTKLEESAKKPAPGPAAKANGAPPVAGPNEYIVKPQDTGAKIARTQGVSLQDLMAVNPGVNWNNIKPGNRIKLPAKK